MRNERTLKQVQRPPMAVVETVWFLKDAEGLIPESDWGQLVEFVGANPEAGDLIPESGGIRKLRWALPGGGKRGGAQVIYLFHNEALRSSCSRGLAKVKRQT